MKRYMITMLAMVLALGAIAQKNRIYIEDFEIYPDSTLTVPVILANVDSTRGIQFNMTLPYGLKMNECELTEYAAGYDMQLFRTSRAGVWTLGMYPMSRVAFPPDTKAVMTINLKATADFMGGDIFLWQCRGSSMENISIIIDDDTTTVTVPSSSLIGIPIDNCNDKDLYFNLMGQPIASPEDAPVAVQVRTLSNGEQNSRKIAKKR